MYVICDSLEVLPTMKSLWMSLEGIHTENIPWICTCRVTIYYILKEGLLLAYYAWPRTYPSMSCQRNPWRQHVHSAKRRRSQAIDMAWRHVVFTTTTISAQRVLISVSVSTLRKSYTAQQIVSRPKHNMLSLLHAACLKLLVFFFSLIHDTT